MVGFFLFVINVEKTKERCYNKIDFNSVRNKFDMDESIKQFYKDFYDCIGISEESSNVIEKLKKEYFADKIKNETLFKFIAFDDNTNLNFQKINALKNKQLWFGAYYVFEDGTEMQVKADYERISKETGCDYKIAELYVNFQRELKDVCCLTTSISEEMWNRYANNHSGICLVFKIKSYSFMFPVIYTQKSNIDYTDSIISVFKSLKHSPSQLYLNKELRRISFEPIVLKNSVDYAYENEVRLLCGDSSDYIFGPCGERLFKTQKKNIGYKGCYYTYDYVKLELSKIIVGKNINKVILDEIISIANEQNVQLIYEK